MNSSATSEKKYLLDTAAGQAAWIRETFIAQTVRLAAAGFSDVTFLVIGQGIETMGAFLDKKPFRAPGQSRERFGKALEELFPPRYAALNGRDFLYRNLRSSLTHLSVGSPHLVLALSETTSPGRHLSIRDKKTILVLENLLEDYRIAWERVIERLETGILRIKPLAVADKTG